MHILDVQINAEGSKLAYLSPVDENGESDSGYRISGPKGWGGTKNLAKLKISDDDLIAYITGYAPKVLEKLQPGNGGGASGK